MIDLAYCGDDCNLCPRYIAAQSNSIEKLKEVAALWKKAGWREDILSPEEMVCYGCATVRWCRYDNIRKCAKEKSINNCGLCSNYPCGKIEEVFSKTEIYAKLCKKNCSQKEYELLHRAFFSKKQNLDKGAETMLKIHPVETNKDIENVRELFEEYADFLNEIIGKHNQSWADHHSQKILKETKELHGEYTAPKGCILLAKYKDEIAGCVAISEIGIDLCELKRLYVKPQFRRIGIGRKLADAIIEKAVQLNYKRIRLDASDLLSVAKSLYKSLGFKETGHIQESPLKSSVHMELKLK